MSGQAHPVLRDGRRRVAILAAALLACTSGPWVSAAPVELPSAGLETDLLVARCVNRAQELGYSVSSVDYQGGQVSLLAFRSDAVMLGMRPVPKSRSWLSVKVEGDGQVSVRAYGDLVEEEEGRMHPGLRAEMDWLAAELARAIERAPGTSDGEPVGDPG